MSESAFVVLVPEAEACVGELRKRFDASSHIGVPAHVTILVPFMAPEQITSTVLILAQAALTQVKSFHFSLSKVGRFPATTYLVPEPASPFISLTTALAQEFPDFPPFRGEHESIIPHLTVANGNVSEAEVAAVELASMVQSRGAIHGFCSSVSLLENSSGQWKETHVFSLPDADG